MVVEIVCRESFRSFFKVQGSQQKVYHILHPGLFCPCVAYTQHLNKSDGFLVNSSQCKHLIAVNIAVALDKVYKIFIPDECFYIYYLKDTENSSKKQ
jgi:predicted nucleic acid-binding Zn finger protein